MATDMEPACDDDDELVGRCDGCGGVLEQPCRDDGESLVVMYHCFHVLHAGCADGRDDACCPRCHTPRLGWVHEHDDGDHPPAPAEQVDETSPASPPPSRFGGDGDGEMSPASMSGSGRKRKRSHASRLGSCACACSSGRVAELEDRLTETTNALESELESARSRIRRLEEMHDKLEEEFIRVRDNGKRAREIEDGARHGNKEDAGERRKERL